MAGTSYRVAPYDTGQEIDNDERLKKKELGITVWDLESEDMKACKRDH